MIFTNATSSSHLSNLERLTCCHLKITVIVKLQLSNCNESLLKYEYDCACSRLIHFIIGGNNREIKDLKTTN